jgi:DNA-binding MarR family transcriptional regulator
MVTEMNVKNPGSMALLTRLSRTVYRRSNEQLLGINLKYFVVLSHVRDHNGVAQQALGETLCVDRNNLVLLLNGLESEGLLARRRDPDDRRRHIVEITDAGLQALEHAELQMEAVEDEVLAALSPVQRETLHELLACALHEAELLPGAPDAAVELGASTANVHEV